MGSVAQLSAIILLSQEIVQPQPATPGLLFCLSMSSRFYFPSLIVAFSVVIHFAQTLQYKLFILAGVNSSGSGLVPVHTERTVSTSRPRRARVAVSMQADNGSEQDFPRTCTGPRPSAPIGAGGRGMEPSARARGWWWTQAEVSGSSIPTG